MSKFIVHCTPGLHPERAHNIRIALEQIKDVEYVEVPEGSMGASSPYGGNDTGQTYVPPRPPPAGGYAPPPQENYAPHYEQQPPQNTQQPFAGQAPPQRSNLNNPEEVGIHTQRHAINHAIKWGIKKRLLSLDDLSKMSPEETVKKAMSLIDSMSDEDKKQMGSDLSGNYQ